MNSATHAVLVGALVAFGVLIVLISGVILRSYFRRDRKPELPSAAPSPVREAAPVPPAERVPESVSPATVETPRAAPPVEEFQSSRSVSEALRNTERSFFGRLKGLFQNETALKNFDDLEEILYTSDLGPQTVTRLMTRLEDLNRSEKSDLGALKSTLKDEFLQIFARAQNPEPLPQETLGHLKTDSKPVVWMIVGVNGAGKTTTIGKVSAHLARQGKRVLVAAGDTFRAAAGSQLKVWTDRAQVELFSPEGVTDPSAVAFDAVTKASNQNFDVVLIDTAGRLHTQANLMEELKKVKRVIAKVIPEAPHETLIVLDANSGQNALQQAREFHQALALTGVVLTKMDGTAKGGVAVGLAQELKIPIRLIGIGEKIGDLKAFSAREFVDSILGGAS